MTEVDQLLIAAEALVLFTKRHMGRIDKECKQAIKWQGEEAIWKTRDKFQDVRDKYWHLYDDIYMTIEDLKKRYTPAGVDGFINRHFSPVMDLLGDKLKSAADKASCWEQLVMNPEAYKNKDFIKKCGDIIDR